MRIKSFILSVMVICADINVYAEDSLYSSQLGTNAALGSPLLNPNFETTDWNPYEMVTFGIFLSNFCVNWGEDNYETAFSKNSSEGLRGKALESLVFGMGSDSEATKALQSMLTYALNAQKTDRHQVYVRHKSKTNLVSSTATSTADENYAEAKGKNMMFVFMAGNIAGMEYLNDYLMEGDSTYMTDIGVPNNPDNDTLSKSALVASLASYAFYNGYGVVYSGISSDVELFIKGSSNMATMFSKVGLVVQTGKMMRGSRV